MHIFVNGKETEIAEPLTVAMLIEKKGLDPGTVVVEHNMVILPKEEWSQAVLAAGDNLEIIAFVGGG
ncbi:MAG: sulfur carrier protein ThiS [Armatimonadota bacterium]